MAASGETRRRLVCRCLGVASHRILDAIRAGDLRSVAEVTKTARAGGGCGTCHPEIEELLADAHGEPVDPSLRLENRLVAEAEARVRIEGCIDSLLRPRLAKRGVTIESIEIDGLEVRIRLGGSADPEACDEVASRLRKYVCEDLDVVVSS
jgi:NifU-like protein